MSIPGMEIKDRKRRGEWAELRFLSRACELGMTVTRPWGECVHYDLVVEQDGRFLRIQVKSTISKKNKSYAVTLRGSKPYAIGDFDFIAAYIIALDLWYIIPAAAALRGCVQLSMTPGSAKSRYAPYCEAWHLLKEERSSVGVAMPIQHSACANGSNCPILT